MCATDTTAQPVPAWLLDPASPGVRYLALRDLARLPPQDPVLLAAREAAHRAGPIASVLEAMHPDGYWAARGPGYLPKYRSSVWAVLLLAQLGASVECDERIRRACASLLEEALTPTGQFTSTGAPGGTADCLQGNLCWALRELGCDDPRLQPAYEWMARSVTGEGIAPASNRRAPLRYFAGKCGPDFACGANNRLPCAWGAVKVMLAFSCLPEPERSEPVRRAIQRGVEFLFSVEPLSAAYPSGYAEKPSGNWWKFGFPVFYVTDLLQLAGALVDLGYGEDPRLGALLDYIRKKADPQGRYALEYDYSGKTWVDFGPKKQPNPWVTLRALRVLSAQTVPAG